MTKIQNKPTHINLMYHYYLGGYFKGKPSIHILKGSFFNLSTPPDSPVWVVSVFNSVKLWQLCNESCHMYGRGRVFVCSAVSTQTRWSANCTVTEATVRDSTTKHSPSSGIENLISLPVTFTMRLAAGLRDCAMAKS